MKKKKLSPVLLLIVSYLILISFFSFSNYNDIKDLKYVRENTYYTMVGAEQFNEFIENKEITGLVYNVERDYITAKLGESSKMKYGITSSGVICLGNVLKLIEDKEITNTAVLEMVDSSIEFYRKTPIRNFYTYIGFGFILSFSYIIMKRLTKRYDYSESNAVEMNTGVQNKNISYDSDTKTDEVKMSDVKGHDEIKADIEFLIKFIKNPEKYAKVGAKLPKGVLLFGPPGTGKTMIAKAIANEAGIPFYATGGSDFIEKYVGVGAQRIRDIFKEAKKNGKAIIYIDEIDAVGRKRGGENDNDERANTLNALLMEMDGFKPSQNILVIGSTNRIDILDDALLRPGRFDRHISVNVPDYKGRLDILTLYAKNKKLDKDVKLERVATLTRGFSGAELSNLMNEAAMLTAFRDKNKTSMEEVDDAFYKIVTKGDKKKDFERSKRDTDITAWHEAGHAVVSKLLANQKVNKVTIIPSTSGAGGITLMEPKEDNYYSKEDLENRVKVSYGGRAAEYLLLGSEEKVTTGASNDIEQATNVIMSMIGSYGMSSKYGLLNLEKIRGLNQEYLLTEAKEISNRLYKETVDFLVEHKGILQEIALRLVEKETIEDEEIDEIIKGYMCESTIIIPEFEEQIEETEEKKKNVLSKLIPDKLLPDKLKNEKATKIDEK